MKKQLEEYEALDAEKRHLEESLKETKARLGVLETELLDIFADSGMTSAKINGTTIFVRNDLFVSKGKDIDTQLICDTLRELGFNELVKEGYNAASLKSLIRELQDKETPIPPNLDSLLNIGTVPRISTRKGS